jgi:hypothetical protein
MTATWVAQVLRSLVVAGEEGAETVVVDDDELRAIARHRGSGITGETAREGEKN